MLEKWTNIEAQSQHCTRSVVGRPKNYIPFDPLQHTWTESDAQAGRCIESEVGTKRFPPSIRLAPPPDWEPPFTPTSDVAPSTPGEAVEQAFQALGAEAFIAWAKKNPTAFFDQLVKQGMGQLIKAPPPSLPTIEVLTDDQLNSLSIADLTRILLKSKGIETASDLKDALGSSDA